MDWNGILIGSASKGSPSATESWGVICHGASTPGSFVLVDVLLNG
jgi:hypothetical protein